MQPTAQLFLLAYCALLAACHGHNGPSYRVTLYTRPEELGLSLYLAGSSCINVQDLENQIKSIDTHDTCVKLYENRFCSGRMLKVDRNSTFVHDLRQVGFADITSSVGPCEDNPNPPNPYPCNCNCNCNCNRNPTP
ncbi:uncharacterized protein LOC103508946 isoform X2 [Diaphorina citri]|uniref:Uncharacterized protein LOC103508946 isoform X2 n=1 Tax=Diaphorina citri TaxID=121845 RepID=A0A3Q0ISG6_DIACI|nr:uncharacterized protein LOC103508946 isoform X2 [Diaphorina citri]KAI5739783.1 hypothetical protein M8J77_023462 [Diaphorina citri]